MWGKLILKEKDYEILTKGIASGVGIGILIGVILSICIVFNNRKSKEVSESKI